MMLIRWVDRAWRALHDRAAIWRLRRAVARAKAARFDEVARDAVALYRALDTQRAAYDDLATTLASTQAQLERARGEFAALAARRALDGPALDDAVARALFEALEPLLVQAPALRAAVEQGADVRVQDALDLLAPLDQLLSDLGITAIGAPGALVPYDRSRHRLAGPPDALAAGVPVLVRFPGYVRAGEVVRRAEVTAVEP